MSRLAFWRRAPCAGCGAESAPVDLLQLVDAQETALAELIEESHCAMRKLLQTHPIPENRTIDTARFSNRLNAQLEHLRVYMAEERSKLQQTLAGTEPSRCSPFSFLNGGCFGEHSLAFPEGVGPNDAAEEGRQVWWSRRFCSRSLEHAYRQHHLEVWRPRVRSSACACSLAISCLTVIAFMGQTPNPKCAPTDRLAPLGWCCPPMP